MPYPSLLSKDFFEMRAKKVRMAKKTGAVNMEESVGWADRMGTVLSGKGNAEKKVAGLKLGGFYSKKSNFHKKRKQNTKNTHSFSREKEKYIKDEKKYKISIKKSIKTLIFF